MEFIQLNENLYLNKSSVLRIVDNEDSIYKYIAVTNSGNKYELTEEQYEELKDYEGGGGGSGGNSTIQFKNIEVDETSWIESDEYEGYNYKAVVVSNEKIKEAKDGFVVFEDITADDPNFAMDVKIDTTEGKVYIFAVEPKEAFINRVIILLKKPVEPDEGGASLNVVYSLTKPKDTSKIWIQCDKPEKVIINNENRILYDNLQCEIINDSTIITSSGNSSKYVARIGDYVYVPYSRGSISGATQKSVISINLLTGEKKNIAFPQNTGGVCKFDDETLLVSTYIYWSGSWSSYYEIRLYKYNVNTEEQTLFKTINNSSDSFSNMLPNMLDNNILLTNGSNSLKKYNIITDNIETIDFPNSSDMVLTFGFVFLDNKIYYLKNVTEKTETISSMRYYYTKLYLYYYDIDKAEIVDTGERFYTTYDTKTTCPDQTVAPNSGCLVYYKGKFMIIDGNTTNCIYNTNAGGGTYSMPFEPIDRDLCYYDETGIYLIGGATYGARYYRSSASVTNLGTIRHYTLMETIEPNVLQLTSTIFSKSLPLIISDNLVVYRNIGNAYIGDNDSIAQSVNMYVYDEESQTWKGVNCPDYEG